MILALVAALTVSMTFEDTEFGASIFNTGEQNSAAFEDLQQNWLAPGEAAEIQLSCGTYRFARQLDLIRPILIRGAGGGPWNACTRLLFPSGSHGFFCHSHTTFHGYDSQDRCGGARTVDLRIAADTPKAQVRHAFVVKDPIQIERVYVENWSGDGLHASTGMPLSSASLTKVKDFVVGNGGRVNSVLSIERADGVVTVQTSLPHYYELDTIFWLHKPGARPLTWEGQFLIGQKGTITEIVSPTVFRFTEAGADSAMSAPPLDVRTGHGVYTHGGDSNRMHFEAVTAINNAGCGIFEDSFLGNSYSGALTDSNQMCAYSAGLYQANAANEFISCYSEQNQPYSYFGSPTVVIGGTHGATVIGRGTHLGAGGVTEVVAAVKGPDGRKVGSAQLGGSAQSYPSYLTFSHESDPFPSELTLGNGTAQLGGWGGNWLAWKYVGGSGASFMLPMKGAKAPPSASRDVEPGGPLGFPKGFHGARGCHETEHYAVPQPHEGQNCDRRWHTSAPVGAPALYMKVGGTWRPVAYVQ